MMECCEPDRLVQNCSKGNGRFVSCGYLLDNFDFSLVRNAGTRREPDQNLVGGWLLFLFPPTPPPPRMAWPETVRARYCVEDAPQEVKGGVAGDKRMVNVGALCIYQSLS